jgi:chemotaxis protein MotB
MTAAGRGAYAPIAPNTNDAGRSLNRRVEILVPRLTAVTKTESQATEAKIPSIKPTFADSANSSPSPSK